MKNVFLYYSNDKDDEEIVGKFRKHLAMAEDAGLIRVFDGADIELGIAQPQTIKDEICQSEIIVLCLSVSLFNEDRFNREITPAVLQQYGRGNCLVVPVRLGAFLYPLTKFAKLKPAPSSGSPIEDYPSKDNGFAHVMNDLLACVEQFDTSIAAQKQRPEFERIKAALEGFNFYEQFPDGAAARPAGLDNSPFSVLLLKGKSQSGHDLLGWRWREKHLPGLSPEVLTYHLGEPEKAANIEPGIWKLLHQGADYTGNAEKLTTQLAAQLHLLLQERALVVRFDGFEPVLHQSLLETFLENLATALQSLRKQKPDEKAAQPLWFYILYKYKEEEVPFSLQFAAQVSLPTIKAVSKDDFIHWKSSPEVQQFEVLHTSITFDYNKGLIIKNENNEVMEVLDRICQSVYAKEDLYDKYIATKK